MQTKSTLSKIIYFAFALLISSIALKAQPNIQHSIYFKEKICTDSFLARPVFTVQHSKGSCYMTYMSIDEDSTATYSYSAHFAKFDNNWDTVFTKVFNGHGHETVNFINELPNGNLLISGYTESEDGGIMFNNMQGRFIWMLEVDTMGNFVKSKTFGSAACELTDLSITSDGYILLAGNTSANQYDFTHVVLGSGDAAWIAKYDTAFNKVWIRVMDGSGEDGWPTIKEISTEKYIVGFMSDGMDPGSVPAEANGKLDLIVHFIDSAANIIWKHRYGSVEHDGSRLSVVDQATKNIYFVGYNEWSATGTVTYASGTCWIQKIDTLGNNKGSKSYGAATDVTYCTDAIWYGEKLWIVGRSPGGGADMEPETNPKSNNAWIGVVDTNVNLVSKFTLVTANLDWFADAFTSNNDLCVNGQISSYVNPYKCDTNNITGIILNIGLAPLGINEVSNNLEDAFILYPNPTGNLLHVKILEKYVGQQGLLNVYDVEGKIVYKDTIRHLNTEQPIECENWKAGAYTVKLSINKKSESSKQFIKY